MAKSQMRRLDLIENRSSKQSRSTVSRTILVGLTFSLVSVLQGCIHQKLMPAETFDSRPLLVQTLSLFDQRQQPTLRETSWKGDWIFRRQRLEMVDAGLRATKPDLLLLQDVLAKIGSPVEDDERILSAGALKDYTWQSTAVGSFSDTNETYHMATAAGIALRFGALPPTRHWVMGRDGYLQASQVIFEGSVVAILNVQMPKDSQATSLWARFIGERARAWVKEVGGCQERLIVGGYMPGSHGGQRYEDLQDQLMLKEAAVGYCQIASKCHTATPVNDIYSATEGGGNPERQDRIFVPKSAYIYSSVRNFDAGKSADRYLQRYGLLKLWPTRRFGWLAGVRLPRCSKA